MNILKPILALLLLNFSFFSFGQRDTTQLEEVILKTKPQELKALKDTFLSLNSQSLIETPQQNFTAVLQKLPGVFMQQGALNTTKITIRGVGARAQYQTNRLKLYLNNIPITTANGTSTLDDFDVLQIDKLSVVKGPKATQYGGRLGGVLLLNSQPEARNYFNAQQNFGSNAYFKQHYQVNTSGGDYSIKLSYNNLSYGGFRENSNYQRESYLLSSEYKLSDKHQLKFLAHGVGLKAYIPSSLNQTDLENEPESAAFTWAAAQGYEHYTKAVLGLTLVSNWDLNLNQQTSVFYTYNDAYEPRPFDILQNNLSGVGLRHTSTFNFKSFKKKSKIILGAEFKTEQVDVSTFENLYEAFDRGSVEGSLINRLDQNRQYLEAFTTYQVKMNANLDLEFGLALNSTQFDLSDLSQSTKQSFNYNLSLLPKLMATYEFSQSHALQASMSKGFSVPTIEESLTETGQFNTNLKPEEAWQYELNYTSTPFNWLAVNLSAYYIDVKNLIVARRVAEDRFVGINAGSTDHPGLEVSLVSKFEIAQQLNMEIFVNSSFNFYKFDDFVDAENDYSGNELTGVASQLFNFGFTANYKDFKINLLSNAVSELPVNDANTVYTEAYLVSHLNLAYTKPIRSNLSVNLSAGIQNIFDQNYAASVVTNAIGFGGSQPRYFYPGEPRQFFGSIGLTYNF